MSRATALPGLAKSCSGPVGALRHTPGGSGDPGWASRSSAPCHGLCGKSRGIVPSSRWEWRPGGPPTLPHCAAVCTGRTGAALGVVGGSLIDLVAEFVTSRTYALGRCDCRFPAAIYYAQMLITEGGAVMNFIGTFVFSQTMVEPYIACRKRL